MSALVLLGLVAIIQAYGFEAVNGFHDTAHACATSVASGVFGNRKVSIFGRQVDTRYWIPVLLSGVFNFLGALTAGTAVAMFMPKIVAADAVSLRLVIAALLSGLVWNIWTWYKGIPVSSTHCLIGSLVGAGLAAAGLHQASEPQFWWLVLISGVLGAFGYRLWTLFRGTPFSVRHFVTSGAVAVSLATTASIGSAGINGVSAYQFFWAVASLFTSPFVGYVASLLIARLLVLVVGKPGSGNAAEHGLRYAQVLSSVAVSYGHGANDGQKTMGIITLILSVAFGYSLNDGVPFWVIASCAACMAAGTVCGASRIITTVGEKLSTEKISFHDGFSAELVTAVLIFWGSKLGLPLSTTQVCTGSVLGAARGVHRKDTMNWHTGVTMVTAWFATFATTGVASLIIYSALTWMQVG